MGVSHRYRLLSVRGPRIVMRAAWGSLAAGCLLVPLLDASSSIKGSSFLLHVESACG